MSPAAAAGLPAAPQDGTPRTHWPAVLAAALAGVAIAVNIGKLPLALPLLRSELGLSLVQAGWVGAMMNALAMAAALAVGLLAGKLGAFAIVLGGLGLSAAASLLGLLAGSSNGMPAGHFAWLLGSRFFEGAGMLAVAVAAPALISAATAAADRRFALGVWACYMPVGVSLGIALAPALLPSLGWQGLWVAAAGVLALAAAATWQQRAFYAPAGGSGHPVPLREALAVLRQPLPWLLALCFGLWALQHFALIIWLPTFLKEQRGLGPGWVALLSCAMLLVNVPGNLLGGALVQRGWQRGRLIAGANSITGLCALGLFSDALPDALRFGLCLLLSFVGGLIPVSAMSSSAVLARNPAQISAIQGLIMQGSQLGQFVGTPLIAAVVAASGQWSSARWVVAGAAAIGVALGLWAWGVERRGASAVH